MLDLIKGSVYFQNSSGLLNSESAEGLLVATLLIKVYDPLSVWRQRRSQLAVISKNILIGNSVEDIIISIKHCLQKNDIC